MSDKYQIKNLDNILPDKLDDKKLRFDTQEVSEILSKNFGAFANEWFSFMQNNARNNFAQFKDMDKFLILSFLRHKIYKNYSELFKNFSLNELSSNQDFLRLEKIILIEISKDLNIPKETVRRKINELEKEGIIFRSGKSIILNKIVYEKMNSDFFLKELSKILSICSKYLATQEWFGNYVDTKTIEGFIKKNYTATMRFYYRFIIQHLKRTRELFKDLESWLIHGIIAQNHIANAKQAQKSNSIYHEMKKNNYTFDYYVEFTKLANLKKNITGINASSISEITGVPRATVLRKLKNLIKSDFILKNQKQLYLLDAKGKGFKLMLNNWNDSQIKLYDLISNIFNLIKKSNI